LTAFFESGIFQTERGLFIMQNTTIASPILFVILALFFFMGHILFPVFATPILLLIVGMMTLGFLDKARIPEENSMIRLLIPALTGILSSVYSLFLIKKEIGMNEVFALLILITSSVLLSMWWTEDVIEAAEES
jgi:hypothetical protein